MNGMPKFLMIVGGAILLVGILLHFFKLGKLPGDIVIKKGNTTFYFPIMTSIILSVVLSVVLYVIGRFK